MRTERPYFNEPPGNQDIVLTTKLQPPSSIHSLVSRPRLLERINQGLERKLTLVCAPAGSGKTTLFTDWLRSPRDDGLSIAWISLDEGDNDPARFWGYLSTALRQMNETIDEHLSLLFQAPFHGSEVMLIHLMNLLTELDISFALILDDYHLISTESIHRGLTFLLEHMPATMHLILLTRFEPPLPLARLRVRGQVLEIREADLCFTPQEIERFFTDAMSIPFEPVYIEALAQRTEGWIAGLQLAALAMRDRADIDTFMTSFTGSSRYIVDYLLEEVINRQPEEIQTFLLSTSILSRLSAPLCASLLGDQQEQGRQSQQSFMQPADAMRSAQEMLERLERMNLFLVPLDHERRWYRYHHLFAEALRTRFLLLYPSQVAELHRRASIWYEQQRLLTEAIEHALEAKDVLRVSQLLEHASYISVSVVSHWTLAHWVKIVPEEVIRTRPSLCFLYAWVLTMSCSCQWEAIERWIEEGMRGLPQDEPVPPEVMGEVAAVRATGASLRGETERTITQVQEALQLLPAKHWQQEGLRVTLGAAYALTGDTIKGTHVLTQAIDISRVKRFSSYFFAFAKNFLGEIQEQQGHLREAAQLYQEVIEERGNQPDGVVALAYGGLGNVLLERNELDAAYSVLQQGVKLHLKSGRAIRTATNIYVPLARVQYLRGEVEAAFATLARLEQKAEHDGAKRFQAMIAAKRAHLHLQQGDMTAVIQWTEEWNVSVEEAFRLSSQVDPHEFEYLVFARVLIAQGRYDQARSLLDRLFWAAHTAQRDARAIEIQILQALNEQAQGAVTRSLAHTEQALTQAISQRYIRVFADEGEPMKTLLSRVRPKERHMQIYVQAILDACQSPGLTPMLPARGSSEAAQSKRQPLLAPLSERELEALRLLAVGSTNAAIAQQLVIAPGTVKRHISNILSKLGVANRTQAVAHAREIGIL